jgi:hypothetical protein
MGSRTQGNRRQWTSGRRSQNFTRSHVTPNGEDPTTRPTKVAQHESQRTPKEKKKYTVINCVSNRHAKTDTHAWLANLWNSHACVLIFKYIFVKTHSIFQNIRIVQNIAWVWFRVWFSQARVWFPHAWVQFTHAWVQFTHAWVWFPHAWVWFWHAWVGPESNF